MSESAKNLIKYFCDRFLKIENYPTKINDILDLPIKVLKDFDKSIIEILNNQNLKTIRDLSALKNKDIQSIIKKKDIDLKIIQNAIIGASLISNAWNKRIEYTKTEKMKVVFAGLDSAGKTSLINRLLNDYNYKDSINIEPTKGIHVDEYKTERLNLILWDLGGQKNHIEEYLEEPEKYFIQVDVLFFVIDSQDDARYDLALNYLNDILNILEFLNEFPSIMILLNKADSNLTSDPDFRIKLEYVMEKITNMIMEKEIKWQFTITPTSVYNIYSNEPEIAKSIKDFFTSKSTFDKKELDSEKVLELSNVIDNKLQKILDINLRLMDKVASELSAIKSIMIQLTPSDISKSLFSIPFGSITSESIVEPMKIKQKVKDNTSEIQKKKKKSKQIKTKSSTGPPKRLEKIVVPEGAKIQQESKIKTQELSQKQIEKEKKSPVVSSSLSAPPSVSPSKPPSTPPSAPPHKSSSVLSTDELTRLKPPSSPNIKAEPTPPDRGMIKGQIIMELKDLFLKRGIVS